MSDEVTEVELDADARVAERLADLTAEAALGTVNEDAEPTTVDEFAAAVAAAEDDLGIDLSFYLAEALPDDEPEAEAAEEKPWDGIVNGESYADRLRRTGNAPN